MEGRKARIPILSVALVLPLLAACGAPKLDMTTELGRQAILDEVNLALSDGNCATAIELIEPLYNSEYSDDGIRLARASAHGCRSGVNFFSLIGELGSSTLSGSGLWETFARLFPSSIGDSRVESAGYSLDALMAILKPGTVVGTAYQVRPDTFNVGSVLAPERTIDSNFYMLFVAMSQVGTLQNRYGQPNSSTYRKTQNLPWTTDTAVDEDGCAFAGGILNLLDAIAQVGSELSGSTQSSAQSISDEISTSINTACTVGCGVPCDETLRDRTTCTGLAADPNSCMAAAITTAVNVMWSTH